MHVLEGAAPHLVRTLPALPHASTGNPEDADTHAEDHAPDALRYLLINLGTESGWLFRSDEDPTVDPEIAERLGNPFGAFVTAPAVNPW